MILETWRSLTGTKRKSLVDEVESPARGLSFNGGLWSLNVNCTGVHGVLTCHSKNMHPRHDVSVFLAPRAWNARSAWAHHVDSGDFQTGLLVERATSNLVMTLLGFCVIEEVFHVAAPVSGCPSGGLQ